MTPQTEALDKMLTRLKLTAIRDQRKPNSSRRLSEAEIARKDQRRITMG